MTRQVKKEPKKRDIPTIMRTLEKQPKQHRSQYFAIKTNWNTRCNRADHYDGMLYPLVHRLFKNA